jgi:shikimate dehydrogenase
VSAGEITPRTVLCGIVLHPAGHTRSPAMHNAAYAALGIEAIYLAFDVPPQALGAAVAGVRALGLGQLSVSIPHKVAIMQHLDEVDETARRIGAVNTAVLRAERLVGSNTDALGAVRALEREAKLSGIRAVVLGAGGSARAVVHGLRERGARVHVLNRTPSRARAVAEALGAEGAGPLSDLAHTPHDVLVNTTSVGLGTDASPVDASAIDPDAVVMDAVYEPERTRFLRDAKARGARTVSGKWMLVHQAVAQLEAWHGPLGRERAAQTAEVMARAFDGAAGRGFAR